MTGAHRDAQTMFRDLGRLFGYEARCSFSPSLPTDGVWLAPVPGIGDPLPVVAIEVVVSESRKTIRGSVLTLEMVSPSLGILLIHEDEIRRRQIRAGRGSAEADRRLAAVRAHASQLLQASRQRIEIWSLADLTRSIAKASAKPVIARRASAIARVA